MKIKTLFIHLLLCFLVLQTSGCGTPKPGTTSTSVEDAEKVLAKQAKAKNKIAKKEQKKAYKRFWKMQSKEAKKSIKRNKRRQKKIARQKG